MKRINKTIKECGGDVTCLLRLVQEEHKDNGWCSDCIFKRACSQVGWMGIDELNFMTHMRVTFSRRVGA